MFRNISIQTRIILFILILFLTVIALAGVVYVTAEWIKNSALADIEQTLFEGQREKIKLGTQTMAAALGKALQGVSDRQEQHDIIKSYIQDYRFEDDESGYYYTYTGTTIFMHPTLPQREGEDLNNTADSEGVYYVRELYQNAQRGGGFVSFVFPKPPSMVDAPKLAYVEYIPGTDIWISTGIYVDNTFAYRQGIADELEALLKNRMGLLAAAIGIFFVLVIGPLCLFLLRSIQKPLQATVKAAGQLSAGNLEIDLKITGRDEITRLQRVFMEMAQSLKNSLSLAKTHEAEAKKQTEEILRATNTIMDVSARVGEAAREMEERISAISKNSTGVKDGGMIQTGKLQDILVAMERLNAGMDSISLSAKTASDHSRSSTEKVQSGVHLVQASGAAIEEMSRLATDLTGNITKLETQSKEIGDIMEVISDIAAQINLLAMNASIEAAHAGEAGKGFGVVAGEVRTLAEKTKSAAQEVDASIREMQKLTRINIASIDSTVASIGEVADISGKTIASLKEAQDTVKEAMFQVQAIVQAVVEQSAASKVAAELVDEVSGIAKNTGFLAGSMDEELHGLLGKSNSLLTLVSELLGKKVKVYVWDESFATYNAHVDEQHRQLFKTINTLLDAIAANQSKKEISKAIRFLADYTERHFSDEEDLLKKYRYPDFDKHKKIHDAFKKTVLELENDFVSGKDAEIAQKVHNLIGDWLVFHIKGMDLQWAEFIREKV
ncbi:MAG: bacteriohemerythrin [Spirochaetales bacterium]|jgi:methyl-accepting chemotaxis protein|nr:bacteriohemerythrin [Spirochaetales bacterium]